MKEQIGTTVSVGAGTIGWLAPINEVLTAVSLIVSIVAGLIVIIPWIKKRLDK